MTLDEACQSIISEQTRSLIHIITKSTKRCIVEHKTEGKVFHLVHLHAEGKI